MKKILFIYLIPIFLFSCGNPQPHVKSATEITQEYINAIHINNKLIIDNNFIILKESNTKYRKYFVKDPQYFGEINGWYITTDTSDIVLSIYRKL